MRVFISLQFLAEIFFILRIIERDVITNTLCSSCWHYCPIFNKTLIFSTDFRKDGQYKIFTGISSVGAELFHMRTDGGWTDRRTDITKLRADFCNFAHAPRKIQNIIFFNNNLCSEPELCQVHEPIWAGRMIHMSDTTVKVIHPIDCI